MDLDTSRRTFLTCLGAAAAASVLPSRSSFAVPAQSSSIRFGYTAMTWGDQERQAIDDIASIGFSGIQFRANAMADFKPAELRDILQEHKLTFVALSSGDVSLDVPPAVEIAKHTANAKFVKEAGGLYLQILDKLKSYPRNATPQECDRLGKLLTDIGKRTTDLGIPLGYHNHLNTISESPANLDLVLQAADRRYVKLELDTAHLVAGGGDPAQAIHKYHDRILFLHFKDVVNLPSTSTGKYPFQFVELGRGRVDCPAVFEALNRVRYRGWGVVELDRVPDKARTPKESAVISKTYLQNKLGAIL